MSYKLAVPAERSQPLTYSAFRNLGQTLIAEVDGREDFSIIRSLISESNVGNVILTCPNPTGIEFLPSGDFGNVA